MTLGDVDKKMQKHMYRAWRNIPKRNQSEVDVKVMKSSMNTIKLKGSKKKAYKNQRLEFSTYEESGLI